MKFTPQSSLRALSLVFVALSLVPSLGCSALGRDFNKALPEFLRSDQGEDELERLERRKRTLSRSVEETARARADFEAAKAVYESGQFEEAYDLLEIYLESYPDTPEEKTARFFIISAYVEDGEVLLAQRHIKEYFRRFPISEYNAALEKTTYEFAMRLAAGDYDVFIFSKQSSGLDLLRQLVLSFPSGTYADDSQWRLARHHFEEKEWIEAQGAYASLIKNYPESPWAGRSRYNQALCRLNRIKGAEYDPENMRKAVQALRLYLATNPEGDRRQEAENHIGNIRRLLGEKLLLLARYYIQRDSPRAARFYLLKTIQEYPGSAASSDATEMLAGLPAETSGPPETGSSAVGSDRGGVE